MSAGKRYLFAGHAIGASAQFHKLDNLKKLNHVVPVLGASALPVTGGLSKSQVSNYCFEVDKPRRRTLVSVRHVESFAEGRELDGIFETEVQAEIHAIEFVQKLHIEFIKIHLLSTRRDGTEPVTSTKGNVIEGVRLGKVEARIVLDEELLCACGSKAQLAAFYAKKPSSYRAKNAWRYHMPDESPELAPHRGIYICSLVKSIKLIGSQKDKEGMSVDNDTIIWKGFGRIMIGEVVVRPHDRQLTMVRLAMGSDAGGSGTAGDGRSNGTLGG
jgi:hypothetical protein